MLWNCFLDFAVEHWLGCRATELGFAENIGTIEVLLIDKESIKQMSFFNIRRQGGGITSNFSLNSGRNDTDILGMVYSSTSVFLYATVRPRSFALRSHSTTWNFHSDIPALHGSNLDSSYGMQVIARIIEVDTDGMEKKILQRTVKTDVMRLLLLCDRKMAWKKLTSVIMKLLLSSLPLPQKVIQNQLTSCHRCSEMSWEPIIVFIIFFFKSNRRGLWPLSIDETPQTQKPIEGYCT